MSFWLASIHLLNFVAPAFGVAVVLALVELILNKKGHSPHYFIQSFAIYFVVGVAVLMLGLAVLERDGKMLTYLALTVAVGSMAAWRNR
ncbi:MAG TPA: hypothetical protein PK347_03365 [Burkholderiaceae bacterium]|nr:hypothetical protein [Burkholderiaceae bacterium]